MNRTKLLAAAVVTAGLGLSPLASGSAAAGAPAGASWRILDDYPSPSGDVYYFVRAKGAKIQIGLNSFVDFGKTKICVKKAGTKAWVCRTRDLKPGRHNLSLGRIRWQGNYPTRGHAKRIVRFDTSPHRLSFKP